MARMTAATRKDQIVAAVLRLADDLGPDRMTTQAVADAVGLSHAAVFRHFPTKPALWQAVAESIAARLEAAWAETLATDGAPLARLAALVRVQLRQIEASPAIPAILNSRELRSGDGGLRQVFQGLMTRFKGLLVAELDAARAAGVLRPELAPSDAAILLISLVQGLALHWSLGRREFSLLDEGGRLIGLQLGLFGTVIGADAAKGGAQ